VTGSISGAITLGFDHPTGTLASGQSQVVTVSATPTLVAGVYTGSITITDTGGQAATQTEAVQFTVSSGSGTTNGPVITLTPASGGLTLTATASNPSPTAQLTISNSGPSGTVLHYQAAGSINGPQGAIPLTLSPATGALASQASAAVNVGVDAAGLPAGTYGGNITVTDTSGQAAAQTEAVSLTVSAAGGVTGTYTGTYRGVTTLGGVAVSGNLTLQITSAINTAGAGSAPYYAISGTIQATNFLGQTITVQFGPGNFSAGTFDTGYGSFSAKSDYTVHPSIDLQGPTSTTGTVSGSPGHYVLSGAIGMSDAQGRYLSTPSSSFTLTQN
jgi:hypothetical protein